MKKKFLFKNLISFFIPMLIPLLILGSLSTYIIQKFVKEEIAKSSQQLLNLTRENINMIFNEIDNTSLNFDNNVGITSRLNTLMGNARITPEEFSSLNIIESLLTTSASTKSFIHSIYVFYDDYSDKLMTNNEGLTSLKFFSDQNWYNIYKSKDPQVKTWTVQREFIQYPDQSPPTKVISIYKRMSVKKGVIVMNIRLDYMENLINSLKTHPDQSIFIMNSENKVIFSSSFSVEEGSVAINDLVLNPPPSTRNISKGFVASSLKSDRYNWEYISIIPQKTLYHVPNSLRSLTFVLLLVSLMLGMVLAYSLTRKNYSHIYRIINIIDSAESGAPLPAYPDRIKDEYGYIIHNILKTFIEQSYLKVQLSEREYKMQALELLALQSQMNPHFLFNTLNAIYLEALNLTGEPNKVNDMLENLSNILEYSLSSPKELVRLDEEIKYTKSYIKLQKIRYGDKFYVIWDYDENFCDVEVMKFILQPLIENSIHHGIRGKKGRSGIKIKILKNHHYLNISVIDNGLGIAPEKLDKIHEKLSSDNDFGAHIGLYNTNKRLKIAYKDDYHLLIKSKLNLGTLVHIRIPGQNIYDSI